MELKMKRTLSKIGLWVLVVLVCLVLGASAFAKFVREEAQELNAQTWGFPYWIMYLIGIYEAGVSILLLMGKRAWASFALVVMMIVAIIVHLVNDQLLFTTFNIVLILISVAIYYLDKRLKLNESNTNI